MKVVILKQLSLVNTDKENLQEYKVSDETFKILKEIKEERCTEKM